MRQQILVSLASSNAGKEVDVTQFRGERKVQAVANCFGVPREWEVRRSLTQIRPVWRKQIGQALNICLVTGVKKVDIVRRASRTVYDRCNATDDNELYTTLNERRNKPLKVWAHYVLALRDAAHFPLLDEALLRTA